MTLQLRRRAAILGLVLLGLILLALFWPLPAHADELEPVVGEGGAVAFTFPLIPFLNLVIGVGIPFLVGLITTTAWSGRTKALLHLALAAVAGLLTELVAALVAGTTYDIGVGLASALGIFGAGLLTYYGFLKPKGAVLAVSRTDGKTTEVFRAPSIASVLAFKGNTSPETDVHRGE